MEITARVVVRRKERSVDFGFMRLSLLVFSFQFSVETLERRGRLWIVEEEKKCRVSSG
jgi:hypothetical protein